MSVSPDKLTAAPVEERGGVSVSPEDRIKALARKNAIGEADAARLLASVKPAPVIARGLDPFARFGAGTLAGVGLVTSLVAAAFTLGGTHFPGFLDIMATNGPLGLRAVAIEQLAAFPLGALVFWIAGRLLTPHVRVVDMLATVGFARVPAVVFALPVTLSGTSSLLGRGLALVVLIGLALQIYLLVIGFRTATAAQGGRLAAGVVGAILAAEIAAKLLLTFAT